MKWSRSRPGTRAFSSEMDTGSREENASIKGASAWGRLIVLLQIGMSAAAHGASNAQKHLELEVFINDTSTHLIASFQLFDDGRLATTETELAELGIKNRAPATARELVYLDALPSTKYRYDERAQRIFITIDNSQRVARDYDAQGRTASSKASTGYGAVLNYDLLGTSRNFYDPTPYVFSGTSLTLDGRAFSSYGTLNQSAYLQWSDRWHTNAYRLDTTFRYSDQDSLTTYRAGDTISGSLAWTRPIRIGGLQSQTNFGLRPDLITVPLPTLNGTATVPSTVDVYVNNIKTFSQTVDAGPFSISNVPVVSGTGTTRVVVQDSTGHSTAVTTPFYSSPQMLAPGLQSFSIEAGLPRLGYGGAADAYVSAPVASATLRRGIYDGLTLEAHAEGGAGVINAGGGAAVAVGKLGVVTAALSASRLDGNLGMQAYAGFETHLAGINLSGESRRTFGSYDDLASATARWQQIVPASIDSFFGIAAFASPPPLTAANFTQFWATARPPKALDRITIGMTAPWESRGSVGASFVHLVDAASNTSNIVTLSWSRSLPYNATIFTSAFADLSNRRNVGTFAGLSIPLFDAVSASTSVSAHRSSASVTTEASRGLGSEVGSYGWRVRDGEGAAASRDANFSYRTPYARVAVGASQTSGDARGAYEVEGAIASMGGGVFFANRIDDAFAVVETDAPGVPVMQENRPIGVTDSRGLLLIPTLRSYDKNQISIDSRNLPVDAEIKTTRNVVAPADRSGVLIDFGVKTNVSSALLVFTLPTGAVVPIGSTGRTESDETFVVGYDGQAFLKDLKPHNSVRIDEADGTCQAEFDFRPRPGDQVIISPVVCARTSAGAPANDGSPIAPIATLRGAQF